MPSRSNRGWLAIWLVTRAAAAELCDVPPARLNDDYCDCADGADAARSSACRGARAATTAAARASSATTRSSGERLALPASRVGDGICDCCDGSDRLYHPVECENVCDGARAARRALKRPAARRSRRAPRPPPRPPTPPRPSPRRRPRAAADWYRDLAVGAVGDEAGGPPSSLSSRYHDLLYARARARRRRARGGS